MNRYVLQIHEQRKKLRHFLSNQIKDHQSGIGFEPLYKEVCRQYENFYTKEFVFKIIDELFQMGVIYETKQQTYQSINN